MGQVGPEDRQKSPTEQLAPPAVLHCSDPESQDRESEGGHWTSSARTARRLSPLVTASPNRQKAEKEADEEVEKDQNSLNINEGDSDQTKRDRFQPCFSCISKAESFLLILRKINSAC